MTTTIPEAEAVLAEIRAEMARQKVTTKALAAAIGKHEQTVGNWINGRVDIPLVQAFQIAAELDLPLSMLYARAAGRVA